jgi:hypothetical protein
MIIPILLIIASIAWVEIGYHVLLRRGLVLGSLERADRAVAWADFCLLPSIFGVCLAILWIALM